MGALPDCLNDWQRSLKGAHTADGTPRSYANVAREFCDFLDAADLPKSHLSDVLQDRGQIRRVSAS